MAAKELRKNVSINIFFQMIYSFIQFLRSMIIPKILDPVQYGVFNHIRLIFQYFSEVDIGILHGYVRYYPLEKDDELTLISFYSAIFQFLIFSLAGIFAYFLIEDGIYSYGVMFMFFSISFYKIQLFLYTVLRVNKKFKIIGIKRTISITIALMFYIVLGYYFDVLGVISSFLILQVCLCALLFPSAKRYIPYLNFRINKDKVIKLVNIGFVVLLIFYIKLLIENIDRYYLEKLMTEEEYGIYSFGKNLSGFFILLPISFSQVFSIEIFSIGNNENNVFHNMLKKGILVNYLFISFLPLASLVLKNLIPIFYKDYANGLDLIIFTFSLNSFFAITSIFINILLSKNKKTVLLCFHILFLLAITAFYYFIDFYKVLEAENILIGNSIIIYIFVCLLFFYSLKSIGFLENILYYLKIFLYIPIIVIINLFCYHNFDNLINLIVFSLIFIFYCRFFYKRMN